MVKKFPLWVLPFNFGNKFSDLSINDFPGASAATAAFGAASNASFLTGIGFATVSVVGIYWAWTRSDGKNNYEIQPLVNPNKQTRILADGSRISDNATNNGLKTCTYSDARTLFDLIRRGSRISNNGPMLGYRSKQAGDNEPYVWMTYDEVIDCSTKLAKGLRYLKLSQGQNTFIGVYSKNRPEWIIVEEATYAFNNVLIPLYETLGPDACTFIIKQANINIVFCDEIKKIEGLLSQKNEENSLKYIVLMDNTVQISEELTKKASDLSVQLFNFEEIIKFGLNSTVENLPLVPPTPNDLSTICYTSGTTGTPKGVMLTHGNIVADTTVIEHFTNNKLNHTDVAISFLPLAHMFERLVQAVIYSGGGSVGFFRGDIRNLADDIKTLRPTVLPAVPRILNRMYDKVMTEVNKSKLSKFIFNLALELKNREINNWIIRNDSVLDKVFNKIRNGFGGRVRVIITGSAPITEKVLNFVRCTMGCVVIEGYGQTECVAACSLTIEGDPISGHVGIPALCNIIKLVDVPELSYFVAENGGEVCIKGPNVFKGYYKMPELTAETIIDGWLHTGDIGKWTERGTLQIIDRKKHIFKLAQGEYVAPEKIENIYLHSKYVAQCFVYGESLKTCLIGVVVPDSEILLPIAKSEFQLDEPFEELCKNDKIKAAIIADIQAIGKKSGLNSFEQVKDILLIPEMFTIENDLLTPTLKTKRSNIKSHFKQQLDEIYKNYD